MAIRCNGHFEPVNLETAKSQAIYAKILGLPEVMTWSINRDTNHRTENEGECNELQTGLSDGTFINEINKVLHS
jgi:hypothetical protein